MVAAQELYGIGFYSLSDAARLSGITSEKISRWVHGKSVKGGALWTPLVPKLDNVNGIGFKDLIQIRFVNAFREAGVSLQHIRKALEKAVDIISSTHPFINRKFRTDGHRIYLEIAKDENDEHLLELLEKQHVFKKILEPTFKDLEFDASGDANLWWPETGKNKVVLDPKRRFGKPILDEYNITTQAIYEVYLGKKESVKSVANWYDIEEGQALAAINFERNLAG